jgi:hypothetical protein
LRINFEKKMGLATFWAIFSQAHLVTLAADHRWSGGASASAAWSHLGSPKLNGNNNNNSCRWYTRATPTTRPHHSLFVPGLEAKKFRFPLAGALALVRVCERKRERKNERE